MLGTFGQASSSISNLGRKDLEVTVKDDALKWLRQFLGMSSALVLNVAGPRESKAPGIQARTKAFLEELLWEA
jgi:hypothetical protein